MIAEAKETMKRWFFRVAISDHVVEFSLFSVFAQAAAAVQGAKQGIGELRRFCHFSWIFCHFRVDLQLLGEVEAANDFNIKLKKERMAREREAAKELEKTVLVADDEFDAELTNRYENVLNSVCET